MHLCAIFVPLAINMLWVPLRRGGAAQRHQDNPSPVQPASSCNTLPEYGSGSTGAPKNSTHPEQLAHEKQYTGGRRQCDSVAVPLSDSFGGDRQAGRSRRLQQSGAHSKETGGMYSDSFCGEQTHGRSMHADVLQIQVRPIFLFISPVYVFLWMCFHIDLAVLCHVPFQQCDGKLLESEHQDGYDNVDVVHHTAPRPQVTRRSEALRKAAEAEVRQSSQGQGASSSAMPGSQHQPRGRGPFTYKADELGHASSCASGSARNVHPELPSQQRTRKDDGPALFGRAGRALTRTPDACQVPRAGRTVAGHDNRNDRKESDEWLGDQHEQDSQGRTWSRGAPGGYENRYAEPRDRAGRSSSSSCQVYGQGRDQGRQYSDAHDDDYLDNDNGAHRRRCSRDFQYHPAQPIKGRPKASRGSNWQ